MRYRDLQAVVARRLVVTLAFGIFACGSDSQDASPTQTAGSAAVSAAGKTGGTTAGSAGKAAATSGAPMGGRGAVAGTSATAGRLAAAGHSAVAGQNSTPSAGHAGTSSALDDDAGVHDAGSGGVGGTGGAHAGAGGASAGSSGSGAASATFTQVYALFKTSCAGATCHIGARSVGDMLSFDDQATAYKGLVDAASVSCTGEKRVVAGDPNKSELVHTLQRTTIGSCVRTPRMPDNQPKLPQADIDRVVAWVMAGAPDN